MKTNDASKEFFSTKLLEHENRLKKIEDRLFLLAVFGVVFMVFAIIWSK